MVPPTSGDKRGASGRGRPVEDAGFTPVTGDYERLRLDPPTYRRAMRDAVRHAPSATLVGWTQSDDLWLAQVAQAELDHRRNREAAA